MMCWCLGTLWLVILLTWLNGHVASSHYCIWMKVLVSLYISTLCVYHRITFIFCICLKEISYFLISPDGIGEIPCSTRLITVCNHVYQYFKVSESSLSIDAHLIVLVLGYRARYVGVVVFVTILYILSFAICRPVFDYCSWECSWCSLLVPSWWELWT